MVAINLPGQSGAGEHGNASMRILITGATGFIGRALTQHLIVLGHDIACAIRRPNTLIPGVRTVPVGDIGAITNWRPALQGISVVVHLAGLVHLPELSRHSRAGELYNAINIGGTRSLALAAAEAGVDRLIFVSSISVNGETSGRQPFREEDPPAPHGAYALSKLEAERSIIEIAETHAMTWCIVRPPLVYGQNARGNFQRLAQWIARGWPLPLGSATAKRSYIALDNLVSVLVAALDAPGAADALLLASDGEDVSTADFVRCIAKHMGTNVLLVPVPPAIVKTVAAAVGRASDAIKLFEPLQIDNSLVRDRLTWKPVVTLDEGMRRAMTVP
jgi:nucleoside-diphosphate-sugar epimerase